MKRTEVSLINANNHSTDSNVRGLIYMAAGFFLFASADALAKFLTDELHPIQIAWSRQLGLLAAASILLLRYGPGLLHSAFPKLQITRGALAVMSSLCFIFAIRHVPIADAVAVSFVAPFMVTIMGVVFLGEHVGIRRWSAIGLGFMGAMIIIRPGLGIFHPAIFLVLAAATFFAMRQVISRALSASDRTDTTIAYTAIISVIILTAPLPLVWQWPANNDTYWLIAAMAALAGSGEIMVIRALQIAEAAIIAPMHYSLILWATFYGWIIFNQLPDFWTWIGTLIITATGIYLINRVRYLQQKNAKTDRWD